MIDSHCHLAGDEFTADLDAVVGRAKEAGLAGALVILGAEDQAELARASAVSSAWDEVRFSVGVHPHQAGQFAVEPAEAARQARSAIAAQPLSRAVGEIGLDYHYDFAPRDVQREVFAAQLEAAATRRLPVVIHTREASDDTFAILRDAAGTIRAVMHCFTGTADEARQALDLGCLISFAGILTFPKAGSLRDVAAFVPDDRWLVETDAPFLAPVPYRGKRNEPAWVAETLTVLAATRRITVDAASASLARTWRAFIGAASR